MKKKGDLKAEKDLVFLGLAGLLDPPREGVAEAVQSFRNAHVQTVMITGDHVDTALAIAKELGIAQSHEQCMSCLLYTSSLRNRRNSQGNCCKQHFSDIPFLQYGYHEQEYTDADCHKA